MQRVNLIGPDRDAMADLVRVHAAGVVTQTLGQLDDGRWRVQAFAEDALLADLVRAGFTVEHVEDVAPGAAALAAAGAVGGAGPTGYMDVAEVDRRLAALAAAPYAEVTELLPLPYPTWEKRSCQALRIGPGAGSGRPGICFLGGMHAR